jgi:beta-glucanase (GH16 family)
MRSPMRVTVVLILCFAGIVVVAASPALGQPQSGNASSWKLIWSDEFNGPDGSAPDPAKWVYDLGGSGWGNDELESYTDRRNNSFIDHGNLVIRARKEHYTGADGKTREFTSARLKTLGKFSRTYGRFEARIKIPRGLGMWPAFWMLGDNFGKDSWPECGEIDIMENVGQEPSIIHGSIHGPGSPGGDFEAPYALPAGKMFADQFYVFALEWEPDTIRFYVDDHLYATRTRADLKAGQKWVFDRPFFLLLNVAVGGTWPGPPDNATVFPQDMLVDYVRVYERIKH